MPVLLTCWGENSYQGLNSPCTDLGSREGKEKEARPEEEEVAETVSLVSP